MALLSALALFALLCTGTLASGNVSAKLEPFRSLQKNLVREGFDKTFIRGLYARPETVFDQQGITAYFLHRESKLNYGQFLSKRSISKASVYLKTHARALSKAQDGYGVRPEIITAILLVETRLGTFVGRRPVFITLSNMAAIGDKATRDFLWDNYIKGKAAGSRKRFSDWAARKSHWAFGELKAYLKYIKNQGLDALSMRGSYAGALGYAQFVPSSVLKFGKDADKDGQINLYQHGDAIESVANYLKQHGWKPDLSRQEAFRVLLYYNNSKYYANTILKVADRLSGSH